LRILHNLFPHPVPFPLTLLFGRSQEIDCLHAKTIV
jgi:hypothetical protein